MANTENFAGAILNGMEDIVENLKWRDKPILKSNEPINKLGKFIMGDVDTGIRGTLHNLSKAGGEKAFKEAVSDAYHIGEGEARKLNTKAILGTYVGASIAGRVLTGGGIYRDSTGNPNIPVIPFI